MLQPALKTGGDILRIARGVVGTANPVLDFPKPVSIFYLKAIAFHEDMMCCSQCLLDLQGLYSRQQV